ncbi:MAG: phosphatase PAP2 family protein [Chlamydiia bacterium]|nr:phosphatase PAP2 family protein [Chlamydiia bacterium]
MKKAQLFLLPILMMALIAPFTPMLDMAIEHYFYSDGHFTGQPFFQSLYRYGLIPSQVTGGIALLAMLHPRWRKAGAMVFLTLIVGCILIVNVTLKDHWGRPRPKQVEQFGGDQQFRAFYDPNFFHQPAPSRSFPCGHCSAGFFFFSVAFAGYRLKLRWLEFAGYLIAIVLGVSLSLARMAMGGHFFSDTLMSALVMWLTALTFDWYFFEWRVEDARA